MEILCVAVRAVCVTDSHLKALRQGEVSRVAPIDKLSVVFTLLLAFLLLKEPVSLKTLVGALLITAGSIVMLWR